MHLTNNKRGEYRGIVRSRLPWVGSAILWAWDLSSLTMAVWSSFAGPLTIGNGDYTTDGHSWLCTGMD